MVNITHSRCRLMQYISVKGNVIDVNLTQSSYSIELNVFGSKVRYKLWHLSEGSVHDCICTAISEGGYYKDCGYYLRVTTIKTVAII